MVKHPFHSLCQSPKILAIMPTLACTASCKDCGSSSNPNRQHKLDRGVILKSIKQAKDLSFAKIVFTGGEATLEWETLLEGLEYSRSLGLQPRLVTNAHWAHSLDCAKKRLIDLVEHGLDEINYSTGDEHARFVPLQRVLNAILATVELNLDVNIMVEYRAIRTINKEFILNHPILNSLSKEQRERIRIVESPWMPINPMIMGCYAKGDTIDSKNVTLREGCPSILQTYIIEADGRIAACCGLGISEIPELYVSHVKKRNFLRKAIEAAENDFLKIWIRYKGPEKILAWASKKNPKIRWEGIYAHNCQVCHRIYKDPDVNMVIRANYQEALSEVIQSLWFDEKYYPNRFN